MLTSGNHSGATRRRALEALDQELDNRTAIESVQDERRIREIQAISQGHDTYSASETHSTSNSPSSLVRNRRRAFRPSERLHRNHRDVFEHGGSMSASPSYTSPPSQLSPASTVPIIESVRNEHDEEDSTIREDWVRSKRRKLDDGTYEKQSKALQYGWKGQVVPGQLRLDVISCDGDDRPSKEDDVSPLNFLQDSPKSYVTKKNRCTVLLKHQGGMPFALTQLMIKSRYQMSIEDGLVFVDINEDGMLDKTSHYDSEYSPKTHYRQRYDSYRPSQEYMNPVRHPDRLRHLRENPVGSHHQNGSSSFNATPVHGFSVHTNSIDSPYEDDNLDDDDNSRSPRPWSRTGREYNTNRDYSFRSWTDRYNQTYHGDRRNSNEDVSRSESEDEDTRSDQDQRQMRQHERFESRRRRILDHFNHTPLIYDQYEDRDNNEATNRSRPHSGNDRRTFAPAFGAPDPANPQPYHHFRHYEGVSSPPKNASNSRSGAFDVHSGRLKPHAKFKLNGNQAGVLIKFDPPVYVFSDPSH